MKKRMLLVVFCMMLLVILVGCSLEDFESNSEVTPVSSDILTSDGYSDICDYVDPDTGVHYLIFYGYRKGGITPRLNPDGSVMVEKEGAANETK